MTPVSTKAGLRGMPNSLDGIRIIEDPLLTETVEDWSRVRSPSRAARRRKQGHWQNIQYVQKPKWTVLGFGNALVMHPEVARALRARASGVPVEVVGGEP